MSRSKRHTRAIPPVRGTDGFGGAIFVPGAAKNRTMIGVDEEFEEWIHNLSEEDLTLLKMDIDDEPPGMSPLLPAIYRDITTDGVKSSPSTGGNSSKPVTSGSTGYQSCDHIQDKIRIGDASILVTACHDVTQSELDRMRFEPSQWKAKDGVQAKDLVMPDLGIYLANEWENKMKLPRYLPSLPKLPRIKVFGAVPDGLSDMIAAGDKAREEYEEAKKKADSQGERFRWPFALIDWPDRAMIAVEVAEELVKFILAQIQSGKVLDTGCAGAHGRTGTLLAMLIIEAEGLHPGDAIDEVRKRHCRKAIESDEQVSGIFGFGGVVATKEDIRRY